jgi:tetratricopeptide (TPR) repeat protein
MSERLTRREMKRDEVQEWMGLAYIWLSEHWRKVVWAAVGVVALGLVAVLAVVYLEHREGQAQESLNEALEVYETPISVLAPAEGEVEGPVFTSEEERRERARELFGQVRDRYGSTAAGRIASVYLGRIAAAEGDLERARELWSDFVEAAPDHALGASVQLALYSLDREQGRTEELIASLRSAVDSVDSRLPQDALLYELGVTLERDGQKEEAREVFQRLVDEYPASPYAPRARQRVGGGGGFGNVQLGT